MEKRLSIALVILGILYITMFSIEEKQIKDLKKKIAIQELEMKEKQNMINTYANEYLKECECNCGWYEDFYYQYADEVGAYE